MAVIATAIVITVKKKTQHSEPKRGPVSGPPGVVEKKYGDALKLAMQFFDIQKLLSQTIHEYVDQIETVNQFKPAQDSLKWIINYLISAHPLENVLYIQARTEKRPLTQVNASSSGTEVAVETATALALASLVFKSSDSTYSSLLRKHAKELFTFADKHRESYSLSIPEVQNYSIQQVTEMSCYGQLAGSIMLQEINHISIMRLGKMEEILLIGEVHPGSFGITSFQELRKTAEAVMWGSFQNLQQPHPAEHIISCNGDSYGPSDLWKFAISQVDCVLSNNPMKMSYLVGYGDKDSEHVHHRGASIPADVSTSCSDGWKWLMSTDRNPSVALGGLVGGPMEHKGGWKRRGIELGVIESWLH
ncbi:glycosyl hydrolase 9B7 [Actinidia rufa]|uniref:cellulase n=1 Tax=Actinidia rufa TaxID=165716 RepID=A0A7J0FAG6_9ERIC|nr:glycosyl hydrolase 9B7 [Actinidia rufa]